MGKARLCDQGLRLGTARPGPGWETTGLALARTNPMVPMVARTNPAWDQAGLAIWAVYDYIGTNGIFIGNVWIDPH